MVCLICAALIFDSLLVNWPQLSCEIIPKLTCKLHVQPVELENSIQVIFHELAYECRVTAETQHPLYSYQKYMLMLLPLQTHTACLI